MIVKEAKAVAREWVLTQASGMPGFWGTFYHGSANWLADDATLSPTSDLDVMAVLADAELPGKPGKLIYHDVMLEVSYLSRDELRSAESVLGQYHLAGSFHVPSIIADPTGQLTTLQAAVAKDYARRRHVYRRCEDARSRVRRNLQSLREADPFPDQVAAWLFAAGVTTHLLLVAGLKNPTVRRRYEATRALLAEYGRLDFYERLLDLLGCAQMSRARAELHLTALTDAFDAAKTVGTTPFFFSADISDLARPVAIDGSRELIARGDHREAIFWMIATYARCQKVLHHDAPPASWDRFEPGFHRLLADLGIESFADLQRRGERVRDFLPPLWDVAEAIIAANPAIDGA
ncbi:MAG: hypothetical protein H0V24_00535 [Chloroflexia bacterium]|nr:hypothetical protein [Chloroflexia bacterium]